MKLLKNKIFLAIILCTAILTGAFYFVAPNNYVSANDNYSLSILKVDVEMQGDEPKLDNGLIIERPESENENNYYKHQDLINGNSNIAMLLNNSDINANNTTYRQYIKVSFTANEGDKLQFLEVNASLNGIAIDTKEVTGESESTDRSYIQYFDLTDIKLLKDGTPIDITEAQGKFEFTFGYMAQLADGTTTPKRTIKASFYALNQVNYINTNNATIIEPKVANTEDIDRKIVKDALANQTHPNLYSFFNYNNNKTVDYFGSENILDKIYYPTITYNPTKYYVNYTRLLHGQTENITTYYNPANNKVVLTKTINKTTTTEIYDVKEQSYVENDTTKYNYYVEIPLYDIGSYHISFDYVVKQYNTQNYEHLNTKYFNDEGLIDKNNLTTIINENWNVVGDIELDIFGYQLYHTVYKNVGGSSESELTDHTSLFADVTNANLNSLTNYVDDKNNKLIPSTNQAPLFFKYNASIVADGTKTLSYYNRYASSTDTKPLESNVQIDSNTRFTENGYYEVYVVYNYNDYKYADNGTMKDGNEIEKTQSFAFVIENIDPQLKLKTADDKDFDANGFTNQDVIITWDKTNQFNVLPELEISSQSFNSTMSNDITSTYQTQINNGEVTLTESAIYTVTIKYGPCTYNNQTGKYDYSASVSYTFIIDDQNPINDIALTTVSVGSTTDNKPVYMLDGTLQNQVTNKNFIVTYGQPTSNSSVLRDGRKLSGAKITATYTQLLFSENQDLYKYFEDQNKLYIQNGYEINSSNNNLNYTQLIATTNQSNKEIIDFSEISTILTENGVYIFNFVDQAGNSANYIVVLDKTSPLLLKNSGTEYSALKGLNNIVSTDTNVLWGDYKAIEVNSSIVSALDSNLLSELTDNVNIKQVDGKMYYTTPISNAKVSVDGKNESSVSGSSQTFYVEDAEKTESKSIVYIITVADKLGNKNGTTYLEINLDKSLLKAHIEGNAINNVQTISKNSGFESEQYDHGDEDQRLFPNAITNRQRIYVDWLENKGTDYEVGSVTCEFFPLTFESGSTNYPYSQESTQTFDLTNNKTYNTIDGQHRVVSAYINAVYDERYKSSATMPGMYKVIRKYAIDKDKFPQDSKDTHESTYYFYVDRQNIISYFNNSVLIGEDIKIYMNKTSNNGSKIFGGEQFLQEFINDYILETNKLPVELYVPQNKYDYSNANVAKISLNYVVKDQYDTVVFDSTSNSNQNRFVEDGVYTVEIYDNTHGQLHNVSNVSGTNKLIFKFSILNSAPIVSIINKDNIIVTEDAFNTNKVKIGWKEDTDGYMANIDTNNLTIKKLLPSGASQIIYKLTNGTIHTGSLYGNIIVKVDKNSSWKYEIDLSKFNITDDCKLEITVQYQGNEADYGSNFKTTQTIYFDYSAPEYNYNKLLAQDTYLSAQQKSSFSNYNSDVNFENYAFIIDETFKIGYTQADNFWKNSNGHNVNDTYRVWYRQYDKYSNNNDPLTMQSIVPTDARYSDLSQAPQRLRFNENLLNSNGQKYYTEIGNRDLPLYQIINNQPGYYEIIEQDIAGNYRVYTVAIYPTDSFESALTFTYSTKNANNLPADWLVGNNGYYSIINSENMQVQNIGLNLPTILAGNNWFDVFLTSTKDGVTTTASYRTAPTSIKGLLTIEQLISQINNFIYYENATAGYSYGIIISCSNGKTFTVNYKTPGGQPDVNFTGSTQHLTVSFVQDPNNSIYLTKFFVYEAQNGVPNYNEPLLTDGNKDIITELSVPNAGQPAETVSYTFRNTSGTGRNLVFVYVDNFGVEYKTFKIIGLTDVSYEDMIVIDGNFDKTTLTDQNGDNYYNYYTNEIAKLNYQPAIYNINSIKQTEVIDGEKQEPETLNIADLDSIILQNGTTLINLYSEKLENAQFIYEISLTDTLGNNYKMVVNYYSKLAKLFFIDSSNREHNVEEETVVSRALYLTFDKNQFEFETFVKITKSYTNEYGEYFEQTFDAQTGLMLDEGANYIITKYNKFGNSVTYNFTIRKSASTHFYSVLIKPDGINLQEISPSEVRYNYNGVYIEQYFTIYDPIIEVSSTDNLVYEEVSSIDLGNNSFTKVYYIHTDDVANITYEKYIAVTKVNYTRNILTTKFTINENQITNQKMTTVTDKTVVVTMPAYNEAEGNKLQVQIYYNSQYIGYLKDYVLSADGSTMSFELNDSGTYVLYVSDLAGNKHWFNDSNRFTLYVLNNIVYKLNDNYGIANSVFNTNVKLSFDETQTLFTRQSVSGSNYKQFIAVNATLNGRPYTPTRSGENYIFSGYGTFTVRLSGILNNDTENPIITEVKFSIINQNEAKLAHEYIGLNGYEVTNIVKNGVDITDEIRQKLNMLTLNSFAISGGLNSIGGNGHYEIFVKVNHNSIKPTQYFSYKVWINNDTNALILCSLKEGDSTINDISLQLNLYQIYSKIGECVIKVNGYDYITINEKTAEQNKVSTYTLTTNQRYNITLETNSGNTLLSFVVTKVEPLNTVAIIVIVVASLVAIGLTVTFILLRKKMKIR